MAIGKHKKAQNAASRKDVFYKRAKEKGYRARSAFKLVHLNNLHGLLKNAKVCLDLCAAPGSWMQVAREFMPSGSVIVGVDLDHIRPIPNTLSIRGDITTESLRSELRTTLKGYKADIVLHDGAPNVGKNWSQDAYDQNLLVLHSFKLACEFLRQGGDFITKVFRSKDSPSLEYVFKSLFKSVESTKPQASRYVSAEIFYVCKHFKMDPNEKIDPKFFDPREVFKEVEATQAAKINLNKPEKVNKKSLGYEDGAEILYKEETITDFINSDRHEELLQQTNAVVFDDDRWQHHPSTSQEIIECCKDIKVLGRKELRMLLSWRRGLRAEVNAEKKVIMEEAFNAKPVDEKTDEQLEQEELDNVQQQITELEARAAKDDKKQQKAVRKQKRELQQKLKMLSMSGLASTDCRDDEFFSIKAMEKVKDQQLLLDQYDASDSEDDQGKRSNKIRYRKGDFELADDGVTYKPVGEVTDSESDDDVADVGEGLFKKTKRNKVKDGVEYVPKENMAIKHKKEINFAMGRIDDSDSSSWEDVDDDKSSRKSKKKTTTKKSVRFADDGGASSDDTTDAEYDDDEARQGFYEGGDSGVGDEEDDENLTTDLVGDIPEEKKERTAESWFSMNNLENLVVSDEELEDLEADEAVTVFKKIGGKLYGEDTSAMDNKEEKVENVTEEQQREDTTPSAFEDDNKLSTEESMKERTQAELEKLKSLKLWLKSHKRAFPSSVVVPKIPSTSGKKRKLLTSITEVPDINTINMDDWGQDIDKPACDSSNAPKRLADLDAVGLALATKLVQSKKAKRDISLQGWNRYMKGDEDGLPKWFVEDEQKNSIPLLDVDDDDVRYYTARDKAINTRTLKKVMEAKVRKQRRFKKTMSTVMKKTDAMQGSSLMTDYDKQQEIKTLYKKAMKTRQKKDTNYVVMTKKYEGKKPKGTKGKYKLVDARLKKDVRAKLKSDKKKKTVGRSKSKR